MDFYAFILKVFADHPFLTWFIVFWSGVIIMSSVQALTMIAGKLIERSKK